MHHRGGSHRFVPRQVPLQSTMHTNSQTRSSEGTRLCLTCRRSSRSHPRKQKHSLRKPRLTSLTVKTHQGTSFNVHGALQKASVHLGLMLSCPWLLKLAIARTAHEADVLISLSFQDPRPKQLHCLRFRRHMPGLPRRVSRSCRAPCRCKTGLCF